MIQQTGQPITFDAFFTANKQGAAGLSVTLDIYDPTGSLYASNVTATEVGGGLYRYVHTDTGVAGLWSAIFKTSDGTVDQQQVVSTWEVGLAGINNLNAPTSLPQYLLTSGQPQLGTITYTGSSTGISYGPTLAVGQVLVGNSGAAIGQVALITSYSDNGSGFDVNLSGYLTGIATGDNILILTPALTPAIYATSSDVAKWLLAGGGQTGSIYSASSNIVLSSGTVQVGDVLLITSGSAKGYATQVTSVDTNSYGSGLTGVNTLLAVPSGINGGDTVSILSSQFAHPGDQMALTTGAQNTLVAAIPISPTPPTAVQVRQEMDLNSTKLANLDAAVSTRLATSGYTAPDNADIAAIKTSVAALAFPSAQQVATAVLDTANGAGTGFTIRDAIKKALAAAIGDMTIGGDVQTFHNPDGSVSVAFNLTPAGGPYAGRTRQS